MLKRQKGKLRVPTKQELESMAEFRYRLRRFLRYSEQISQAAGITPLQYQLLLQVAGSAGREWSTVGELAERLQAAPNGTGALVRRCEEAGLVVRQSNQTDLRQTEVHLTAAGKRCLNELAALHKLEYERYGWLFEAEKAADE